MATTTLPDPNAAGPSNSAASRYTDAQAKFNSFVGAVGSSAWNSVYTELQQATADYNASVSFNEGSQIASNLTAVGDPGFDVGKYVAQSEGIDEPSVYASEFSSYASSLLAGYHDLTDFVGSGNGDADTASHAISSSATRSGTGILQVPSTPLDTNPSTLPVSRPSTDPNGNPTKGPDWRVALTPQQSNPTDTGSTGTSGGSTGTPNATTTTATPTSDDAINRLIDLAAAQLYGSSGGGGGTGGIVALPTDLSATDGTTATDTSTTTGNNTSKTSIFVLVLVIAGLAFWYYKKHKKAS